MVLVIAASPAQAVILYGDYSGTTVDFFAVSEDSVTNPGTPLFGGLLGPQLFGDALAFFPNSFIAHSAGGGTATTSGVLMMTITAKPGFYIDKVSVIELGDWQISGVGATTSVYAGGNLDVTDQTLTFGTFGGALDILPTMPLSTPASGTWSGGQEVDFLGMFLVGVTQVYLELTNTLIAESEPGTTALIQKKVVGETVITVETSNGAPVIPEPSTLLIVGLGLLSMATWRWRQDRRAA